MCPGLDDESIAYATESTRMLRTEWERPSTLFQKIPARPGRTAGEVRELENVAMGVRMRVAAAALALLAAGCTANASHLAASPASLPPDPHTAAALLKIATAFNHDYGHRRLRARVYALGCAQPGDHHPC
jgi:hypothetical protein